MIPTPACDSCKSECVNCLSLNSCTECVNTLNRKVDGTCKCLDTFYNDASNDC